MVRVLFVVCGRSCRISRPLSVSTSLRFNDFKAIGEVTSIRFATAVAFLGSFNAANDDDRKMFSFFIGEEGM